MSILDLESKLRLAQEKSNNVRLRKGSLADTLVAFDDIYIAERELAAAKDEEYLVPLDLSVGWDIGYPMPFFFANDRRAFLTFLTSESNINVPFALVEFEGYLSAKLGSPNDEVFEGHRLYGKGLDPYTAQRVQNSTWIAELESINKVHSLYRSEAWRDLKHYIFWFHDSTFECIAREYTLEIFNGQMPELLAKISERLLK